MHVAEPGTANREGCGESHRLVGLAAEVGQSQRYMHVGCRQHAGVVELAQQPGRAAHATDVERIRLGHEHGHAVLPPSRTSLSASTNSFDGRHANTPHGVPSTVGVSGPTIPRRNR